MFGGEFARAAKGTLQQIAFAFVSPFPNRRHGMNDVLRGQVSGGGDYGRARRAAIRIAGHEFGHDSRAAAAVNCPVDPSTPGQTAVGRVHNRVDLLLGDVSLREFQRPAVYADLHGNPLDDSPKPRPWQFYATKTDAARREDFAITRSALALCGAVQCALPADGRDIHVSNLGGDDRSNGSSLRPTTARGGPVRTIAKALRLAEAGDRIVLAKTAEPYRESLSLTGSKHSGSPLGPLIVEGNGAVLDGSAAVPDEAWRHFVGNVFYFEPAEMGYQQLFLPGGAAIRHPLDRATPALPPLEPLEWCYMAGRVYFRVESGRLPQAYRAACCGLRTGVMLYHVRDVVIRNLVVQGFQFDGIAASDAVRGARLEYVTVRGNGRSGVSVSGASTVEIEGCVLGDNGDSQLRSDDLTVTYVRDSRLIAGAAPAIESAGGRIIYNSTRMD